MAELEELKRLHGITKFSLENEIELNDLQLRVKEYEALIKEKLRIKLKLVIIFFYK